MVVSSGPGWTDVVQAIGTAVGAMTSIVILYIAVRFREEARLARIRPDLTLPHDPARDGLDVRGTDSISYLCVGR